MDAQQAAVAGLACFACACASPAVYVRVRCWAQGPALRLVHAGVPTVLAVQRFDARALTLLFDATAFSVSVPFYGVSLPLLAWVGDLVLVRKLSMLMTLAMWLGNATKDMLALPRPRALSEAVRVIAHTSDSQEISEEYGLPSSHVANCSAFFAFVLLEFGVRVSAAWSLLAVWTALVGLGRLYLGMHTPVDLVAGALVGAAALGAWCQLHAAWDGWLLSAGPWRVAAGHALLSATLAACYPRPPVLTPSYHFVTFFSGVSAGLAVGVARTTGLGLHASGLPRVGLLTLDGAATLLARVAVGAPIMLASRAAFRAAAGASWPFVAAARAVLQGHLSGVPALPRPKSPRVVDAPTQSATYDAFYLWTRFWAYAGIGWGLMEPGVYALRACGLL